MFEQKKIFVKLLVVFLAFLLFGGSNAFAQSAQIQLAAAPIRENYEVGFFTEGMQYPTATPTGITNNIISDSFFLPLFLILLGSWLYFTGRIYRFADWISKKDN